MVRLTIVSILLLISTALYSITEYDANDLANSVSRSLSLKNKFIERLNRFNRRVFNPFPLGTLFHYSMSLDASWFSGYKISTSWDAEDGVLATLYGDMFFSLEIFPDTALSVGMGGTRYGIFLSSIFLPTPDGDPYSSGISVNDFVGNQFFDDIFSLSMIHKDLGALTLFWSLNNVYAPNRGILDFDAPIDSKSQLGANFNVLYMLFFDTMLYITNRHITVSVADFKVDYLSVMKKYLGITIPSSFYSTLGVLWKYVPTRDVTLGGFAVPLEFQWMNQPLNEDFRYSLKTSISLYSPELSDLNGFVLNYGVLGGKISFISMLHMGLDLSLYNDFRLPLFGSANNLALGFQFYFLLDIPNLFNLNFSISQNYYKELENFIESYNKFLFRLSFDIRI